MKFQLFHVDAFADKIFSGNPAAVCVLPHWLSDDTLLAIARENNLPATAFLVRDEDLFHIRWMTPEYELDLCGHGTLAAAHVIFNYLEPGWKKVNPQSRTVSLSVSRDGEYITLNFSAKNIESCAIDLLEQGLGILPIEVYRHKNERCVAVLDSEDDVTQLKPDMHILKNLDQIGVIVTAPGRDVDFASRTFYPRKIISEDPVTGVSHCLLAPYWSKRLNKSQLQAKQLSQRGGEIICLLDGDRVLLSGKAVTYMQGMVEDNVMTA